MSLRQRLRELRESAPSWVISLAVHAGILVAAGMISWVVIEARPIEAPLMLIQPDVGAEEIRQAVEGRGGGGREGRGGGTATGVGGGASAQAATAPRAGGALVPAAPVPIDLQKVLGEPLIPVAGGVLATQGSSPAQGLADALAAMPGAVSAPGGGGVGIGLLDGTSAGFGNYIGQLRGAGLDIVLVLDATDSMSPYIEQAKKRLHQILDVITGLVPNARIGMVAYKDYGDEYGPTAVKSTPITDDVAAIRTFIDGIVAGGGADLPEPIHEAVRAATDNDQMGWRRRRHRVIILVGDSSCHPSGRKEAFSLAGAFNKSGGTISVIDVGGTPAGGVAPRAAVQPDLARVAQEGGGEAFLLKDTDAFWRHLVVSIFGRRFEQDVSIIIKKLVRE